MEKPLTLLLLNYEFPPLGGGASNATYHTALELQKRGHKVDVLTARDKAGPAHENIDGVQVFRIPSLRIGIHTAGIRGAASYLAFARLKLASLMRKTRYDLMHYYFGLPTGLLSLYSHGKHGVPYIVSLRGSDVPGYDETVASLSLLHRFLQFKRQRIWGNAGAVVANSKSLRNLALSGNHEQKIEVISNGVDVQRFGPTVRAQRDDATFRIICVSRLTARKGLDTLLRAIAELKDIDVLLQIVGTGDSERELKALTKSLALESRVSFAGYVAQEDLGSYYRRADAFVLPSLSESCAMALLEAMSCGLPVVVSSAGGNPEIVDHEVNGLLFEPDSSTQLVHALRKLAVAPELRQHMSQNNANKMREDFTWESIAIKYEAVYRRGLCQPDGHHNS